MQSEEGKDLKECLQYVIALLEAMHFGIENGKDQILPYSSYKDYMRKSNDLVNLVGRYVKIDSLVDLYDLQKIPSAFDTVTIQQKNFFEMVYTNLMVLRKFLETKLEIKKFETESLADFLQLRLRKIVFEEPEREIDVQNAIEQLLVGRGMLKGSDYDREVGRVRVSTKEVVPDFIVSEFNLAIEAKLIKVKSKVKSIVDEINADIQAYSKKYSSLLFVIYDLGHIRDDDEFKNDLDNNRNIRVVIIKH